MRQPGFDQHRRLEFDLGSIEGGLGSPAMGLPGPHTRQWRSAGEGDHAGGGAGLRRDPVLDLRHGYSTFLDRNPGLLHFAAHSHHLWPDCTRQAQDQAWLDAATYIDDKWGAVVFGPEGVVSKAQQHIARVWNTSDPAQIAFGQNTAELSARLLSCLDLTKDAVRILTSRSEFHSFYRLALAFERKHPNVTVDWVDSDPLDTFDERLAEAIGAHDYDMVFFSHVLYDSAHVVQNLAEQVAQVRSDDAIVVVDDYHGFNAIPSDMRSIEERAFIQAGGYKYGQGGEGVCFMHTPPGSTLEPWSTGWMVDFEELTSDRTWEVRYPDNGLRFGGSTFDPTAFYRFNAAMTWLQEQGVGVEEIHAHVKALQGLFVEAIGRLDLARLSPDSLIHGGALDRTGHFSTFRIPDAQEVHGILNGHEIMTDPRSDRLRFGIGTYHTRDEIQALEARLGEIDGL